MKFLLEHASKKDTDTLAKSFLPSSTLKGVQRLQVFYNAFHLRSLFWLKNIFLHELGHILGLRHKFVLDKEEGAFEGDVVVFFGARNKESVMSYTFLLGCKILIKKISKSSMHKRMVNLSYCEITRIAGRRW